MNRNQTIALEELAEIITKDCREYYAERIGGCFLAMNGINCDIRYELRFIGSNDKSQSKTDKYVKKQLESYIRQLNYETGVQKRVGQEWEVVIPEKAKAKGYRGSFIKIKTVMINERKGGK